MHEKDQLERFREGLWPGDPLDNPRVRGWQKAKRITLAALLGFSALHYYFVDVQLTILALPHAGVAVPPYATPGFQPVLASN